MAHAKMFTRWALIALAVAGVGTATSLGTYRLIGDCSHAIWSHPG